MRIYHNYGYETRFFLSISYFSCFFFTLIRIGVFFSFSVCSLHYAQCPIPFIIWTRLFCIYKQATFSLHPAWILWLQYVEEIASRIPYTNFRIRCYIIQFKNWTRCASHNKIYNTQCVVHIALGSIQYPLLYFILIKMIKMFNPLNRFSGEICSLRSTHHFAVFNWSHFLLFMFLCRFSNALIFLVPKSKPCFPVLIKWTIKKP